MRFTMPGYGLSIFALMLAAAPASAAELSVHLNDPPASGEVTLLLFGSADTFGDLRDPVKTVRFPADGRRDLRISDIPPGEYALVVHHDENANGRVDKNFIGIPSEPLGFSNGYRPKGPPAFTRAAFTLASGEARRFDVSLYRPLGRRGRLGVGVGVIARSSPYRDYDGGVSQVIPAISYNGERVQAYGPAVQFGLAGSGALRLAATARYRIGVYDESESDFLTGMGDREDTVMGGLAVQAEMPGGLELSLGYEHDILDRIGGGEARVGVERSFQLGRLRLTPLLGINWMSSDLANHDFGVPEAQATPARPAYNLGGSVNVEAGLRLFVELTRDLLVIANASVERLDSEITDSPIVDSDHVVKGFATITYVF
jgi:outer membrane protein